MCSRFFFFDCIILDRKIKSPLLLPLVRSLNPNDWPVYLKKENFVVNGLSIWSLLRKYLSQRGCKDHVLSKVSPNPEIS